MCLASHGTVKPWYNAPNMKTTEETHQQGMKRFAPYYLMLKRVKWQFVIGLVAGIIFGAAGGVGLPFLLWKVIPVVKTDPPPALPVLIGAVLLFPAAMLIRGISGFIGTYWISYCGVELLADIRLKIHDKLQTLPIGFFHRNNTGDLFSRVLQDTASFQKSIVDSAEHLVRQPVQLIGAVGMLIYLSVQQREVLFLLLFLAIIPVIVVPLRLIGKRLLKRSVQLQDEVGNMSQIISENLGAAREVRAFNLQNREMDRFKVSLKAFCRLSLKRVKYSRIISPTVEFVSSIGVAAAFAYVIFSQAPIEGILALFAALYMCYDPLKRLGEVYSKLKQGEASLVRIEYVLNAEDSIPEPDHPVSFAGIKGEIEIEDVSFRYQDELVLKNVGFSVPAGSVVALVGPSGAGKTTLADLIPRFYDVVKGAVKIDGVDVRDIALNELRAAISVVSQDTFLFNATIEDNIRLGRLDASEQDIHAAAKHAYAHDFIEQLDHGYKTIVGDRGTRLSGGQKQRIAIARAFLKNAPILILDEATSALDSESEEKIQTALEELVQEKTVVVIAHRFSTIRNADRIAVLQAGNLVGFGSHDELYPANPMYRQLYDRQYTETTG